MYGGGCGDSKTRGSFMPRLVLDGAQVGAPFGVERFTFYLKLE